MRTLVIIPARGGSKGLPGKNILPLLGKPLINWTIDAAKEVVDIEDICVSTDYQSIIDVVEQYGLPVPFRRPENLATDKTKTVDVILHALQFYAQQNRHFDVVLLLQPTSPLRTSKHIKEALKLYNSSIDMVVSVKPSHSAAVICKINEQGYVESVLNKESLGRQNLQFWEYNGAIYVINVKSLLKEQNLAFKKTIKYEMPDIDSVDIDTQLDMELVELIMKRERRESKI